MLKHLILLVALFVCTPPLAEAACTGGPTTWTTTPDQASVGSCVSRADDGDTVNISAGTVEWTSGITISNKCISVIGAGVGVTVILNGQTSKPAALIALNTKPCARGQIMRLSSFEVQPGGGNSSTDSHQGQINVRGSTASLRIDHVKITNTQQLAFNIVDYVRGVVDHVTCVKSGNNFCFQVEHNLWLNDSAGCTGFANKPGCGDRSWASSLPRIQDEDQLFFEDNRFEHPSGSTAAFHDCSGGAREVFRFNYIDTGTIAQHDEARGGRASRACLNLEGYRNYIISQRLLSCCGIFSSAGGTGMIWDNDIERVNSTEGPNYISNWAYYRRADTPRDHHVFGSVGQWPITSITCTDGTATVTVTNTAGANGRHLLTLNAAANTYRVIIEGSSVSAYNGTKNIAAVPTQSTFTFATTCGGTANNGGITLKQPWDENRDSTGYRGMSQPGAGPSVHPDMVFGTPRSNNLSFAYAVQSYMPYYGWGNRRDSNSAGPAGSNLTYAATSMTCDGGCQLGRVVLNNRDYYNQNDTTCVAGGACTGGVGRGTTLPTTCTPGSDPTRPGEGGVFFWKTNEGSWNNETAADHANHGQGHSLGEDGQGYRCTATDTWTLDYVPADYPHHLITGGAGGVNELPTVAITAPSSTGQDDTSTTPFLVGTGDGRRASGDFEPFYRRWMERTIVYEVLEKEEASAAWKLGARSWRKRSFPFASSATRTSWRISHAS